MRALKKQVARRWFHKALAPGRSKPFADVAAKVLDGGASWALASLVQSYFAEPAPELRPLQVPTLALWGELDRTHRRTDKRSVLTLARDAEIVSFASAGHCPDLEEPEWFRDLLCEFTGRS